MHTDDIRQGLRHVATRAATIDAVATRGSGLVDAVLPLLQDRHEGVRWSAIKILSEIGDDRAIAPLIALIEQRKNATAAANALRSITNQDFGDTADAWRHWALLDAEARSAGDGASLSDGALMAAATRDLPVKVTEEQGTYTVDVSLPEDRAQRIWIDFSRKDLNGRPVVQLCTPCGEADEHQYETALKLNMSIPYGAIALALLDEKLCFAMVDSYLRETVHPEDIAQSIMSLAENGDSVESSLSAEDRF
jgi:hypothetical protein